MKNFAVIGLGQFGSQIAISLSQKGFDVIAIDDSEEVVSEIKDIVSHAVVVDAIDEKAMRAVNVDTVDTAVVSIGSNVQSSLLVAALLQKLGIEDIYVRAINPLQEGILKSMGIENIINIEEEMGNQLSSSLASGKIGRYIQISERHSLMEVRVPRAFVGATLKDLDVRSKYKINIVGIKNLVPEVEDNGDVEYHLRMTDVPDPDYPLEESDMLVIVGTDESIQQFIQLGDGDD
ncbi:MAG: TrkA family potassium uptake protein [bacterium]|nr:TrkA family potassium uptake protein [bacterium]